MRVPFNDLAKQNLSEELNLLSILKNKIAASELIGGCSVTDFEKNFSKMSGAKLTASCANGTDALEIAFECLGLSDGDEVIIPAQTWISTAEAVSSRGATPVFCDTVDNVSQLIDVSQIETLITDRTKGIVPVHLQGRTVNMDKIQELANKYNLWVVEDCAQAHLAKYDNKPVGTMSEFGTFSFYPGKNLGALGDAGAGICHDEALWKQFKMIANHGALKKGTHEIFGRNSRLDSIQAAVLLAKMPHLQRWTDARRAVADKYSLSLQGVGDIELPPKVEQKEDHVYHLYVVATDHRDALLNWLNERGVSCGIHYKKSVVDLGCYKDVDGGRCVNARKYQDRIVSLPIFPDMQDEQVTFVIQQIKEFFDDLQIPR